MSPEATSNLSTEDDIPFGRRAREQGKWFHGGKPDGQSVLVICAHSLLTEHPADISVLVAVVSPVESTM